MKYLIIVLFVLSGQLFSEQSLTAQSRTYKNINLEEKVIYCQVKIVNGIWDIKIVKIDYGVPNKNIIKNRPVNIHFKDSLQNTLYSLCISAPDEILIHGNDSIQKPFTCSNVTDEERNVFFTIPYYPDIYEVACSDRNIDNAVLLHKTIRDELKKSIRQFEKQEDEKKENNRK